MCLGAMYWARVRTFYFAGSKEDAAGGQFDDSFIYDEVPKPVDSRTIPGHRILAEEGRRPFDEWLKSQNKTRY